MSEPTEHATSKANHVYGQDGFISYSSDDALFAAALEASLERYSPPKNLRQHSGHLHVFRYQGDWVGTDYDSALDSYLEDSRNLLVLCSPSARASKYVGDEIMRFGSKREAANIIPIIIAGDPNNETEAENKKAFPEPLYEFSRMPLAVDYRGFDVKTDKVNSGKYESAWYSLLANILHVSRDDIEQRERSRRVKKLRLWGIFATIFAVILGSMAGAFYLQRNASLRSQAELLVNQANVMQARGDAPKTVAFLSKSVRLDPNYEAARSMLLENLTRENWQTPTARLKHDSHVNVSVFNREGNYLASGTTGGKVVIWALSKQFSKVVELTHDSPIHALQFMPGGKRIVSGTKDGVVRIWDIKDKKVVKRLDENTNAIIDLKISKSAEWLAIGNNNGVAHVWRGLEDVEPSHFSITHQVDSDPGKNEPPYNNVGVRISDDQQYLLTRSLRKARTWHLQDRKLVGQSSHVDLVYSAHFLPNTNYVLVGYSLGKSEVFEADGDKQQMVRGMGEVFDLYARGKNSTRILTRGVQQHANLYDLEHGSFNVTLHSHASFPHLGLVGVGRFDSQHERIVTRSLDKSLKLWTNDGHSLSAPLVFESKITTVPQFSPNGEFVIAAADTDITLWTTNQKALEPLRIGQSGTIDKTGVDVTFSPDGHWVGTVTQGALTVIDSTSGERQQQWSGGEEKTFAATSEDRRIVSVSFSPDNQWVAGSLQRSNVIIGHVASGAELRLAHEQPVRAVKFSPDGAYIATASDDGFAYIWPFDSGAQEHSDNDKVISNDMATRLEIGSVVTDIDISPDAKHVLTGSVDGGVQLWRASGAKVWRKKHHQKAVTRVSLGNDLALSGSLDATTRVWLASNGCEQPILPSPREVFYIALNHDESMALTASGLLAQLWNTTTGRPIGEPVEHTQQRAIGKEYRNKITVAKFSSQGGRFATGARDGEVHLWDARTRALIAQPLKHGNEVLGLAFSPLGDKLAVVSRDENTTIWQVSAGSASQAEMIASTGEAIAGLKTAENNTLIATPKRSTTLNKFTDNKGCSNLAPVQCLLKLSNANQ